MRVVRCALLVLCVATACRSNPQTVSLGQDAGDLDAGVVEEDAGMGDAGVDAGPPPICSLQVFAYADGYACNSDGDCANGHCAFARSSDTSWPIAKGSNPGICTTTCSREGQSVECIAGFTCAYAYTVSANSSFLISTGDFCLPNYGVGNLAGNRTLPTGSPCWKSTDCAGTGAVCASIDYAPYYLFTFCTSPCDATHACGDCEECSQLFAGNQKYCEFQGPGAIGTACSHNADCASGACNSFCTQACSSIAPCPDGSTCHSFDFNGQQAALCIAPQQLNGSADGATCVFDFECAATSRCVPSPTSYSSVCTPLAPIGGPCQSTDACVSGLDCRQFGNNIVECSHDCGTGCPSGEACFAPDLNTEVVLQTAGGTQLNYDDNIPNSTSIWSKISNFQVGAGTYYVAVRVSGSGSAGPYQGNYKLTVTDSLGTPTQVWRELPEAPTTNDTRQTAQTMPFPVELSGELSGRYDTDFFMFQVTQSTRLTIETSPGTPSACLPTAQVAAQDLGGPCTANFNCRGAWTCDPAAGVCTSPCTGDGDCGGNGATCQIVSGRQLCASAAQVGHVADGQACLADWQCTTGELCVSTSSGRVCAQSCGASTDGGTASSCGATSECAAAATSTGSLVQACLPLGHHDKVFSELCQLQSDCAVGLNCQAGRCAKTCTSTDQCPYRPSFSSNPLACAPCTDSATCTTMTEEGACVDIGSSGRYCAMPCDGAGGCPSGFSCVLTSPVDVFAAVYVCQPVDQSCRAPVCSVPTDADGGAVGPGNCNVPPLGFAEICATDSECTTGHCISGFCSQACATNADCDCPSGDLFCSDSQCKPAAYTAEVEPNDTTVGAQVLLAPAKVLGSFNAGGNDQDNYSIVLTAGQKISITTRPVCGVGATGSTVYVRLLDSNGAALTYSFTSGYSRIRTFAVTADGTYTIRVDDGTFPYNTRQTGYILEVTTPP